MANKNSNTISPKATIADGVKLGNNVIIHPGVVIESGVTIGDNVEISPNAYIGKTPKSPGSLAREIKFEQEVYIGNYSLIGPCSTIYKGVRIENNCLIGENAS